MGDIISKYFEMLEDGEWTSNNTRENRKDQIVENVKTLYDIRAIKGKNRYGVTMDRNDLSFLEWLTHLQEELMDATIYLEKLKFEYNNNSKKK